MTRDKKKKKKRSFSSQISTKQKKGGKETHTHKKKTRQFVCAQACQWNEVNHRGNLDIFIYKEGIVNNRVGVQNGFPRFVFAFYFCFRPFFFFLSLR